MWLNVYNVVCQYFSRGCLGLISQSSICNKNFIARYIFCYFNIYSVLNVVVLVFHLIRSKNHYKYVHVIIWTSLLLVSSTDMNIPIHIHTGTEESYESLGHLKTFLKLKVTHHTVLLSVMCKQPYTCMQVLLWSHLSENTCLILMKLGNVHQWGWWEEGPGRPRGGGQMWS